MTWQKNRVMPESLERKCRVDQGGGEPRETMEGQAIKEGMMYGQIRQLRKVGREEISERLDLCPQGGGINFRKVKWTTAAPGVETNPRGGIKRKNAEQKY